MTGPRRYSRGTLPDAREEPLSATAQVKLAMVHAGSNTGKRRNLSGLFAFDRLSRRETFVAPLLGVYLGFAVARVHEKFPVLQVPYLLWSIMAIMLLTVSASIPRSGWRKTWDHSPQLRVVAGLTVLAIVTVPLGVWMSGALDFLEHTFTITVAVFLACVFLLRDAKAFRRILAIYITITTIVAGTNVYDYYFGNGSNGGLSAEEQLANQASGVPSEPIRQGFGSLDPNDLAAVMATTAPLALWLSAGSFRRRLTWTPCALVMVVAVIPTASRGGLLGLAAAAIVLILVGTQGFRRILLGGTLTVAALAFNFLAGAQMDRMGSMGGTDYNYTDSEGRIAIWKRGIIWMIRRPWGYGLNNFPTYFAWLNGPERSAHNSLIQYGVELGVLGLAAYLFMCYTLVKSLLRIRRNAIAGGPAGRQLATLTGHVLAMLAACWTTGFFLSNAYYPLTYMAIGIGSAVVLSKSESMNVAVPSPMPLAASETGKRRHRQFKAFGTA